MTHGLTLLTEIDLVTPGCEGAAAAGAVRLHARDGLFVSSFGSSTAVHTCLPMHGTSGQRCCIKRATNVCGRKFAVAGGGGHHNAMSRMPGRPDQAE